MPRGSRQRDRSPPSSHSLWDPSIDDDDADDDDDFLAHTSSAEDSDDECASSCVSSDSPAITRVPRRKRTAASPSERSSKRRKRAVVSSDGEGEEAPQTAIVLTPSRSRVTTPPRATSAAASAQSTPLSPGSPQRPIIHAAVPVSRKRSAPKALASGMLLDWASHPPVWLDFATRLQVMDAAQLEAAVAAAPMASAPVAPKIPKTVTASPGTPGKKGGPALHTAHTRELDIHEMCKATSVARTPMVCIGTSSDDSDTSVFVAQPSLVTSHSLPTAAQLNASIEYDLDEEDFVWLDLVNRQRCNEQLPPIAPDVLELLIDRLEKGSFFLSHPSAAIAARSLQHAAVTTSTTTTTATTFTDSTATKDSREDDAEEEDDKDEDDERPPNMTSLLLPMVSEDSLCTVCLDGESVEGNAILFCEMCNIAVHQDCYGVPYIPDEQWLCRRCIHSPSRAVSCVLCSSPGGALKQVQGSTDQWAHVQCAAWIREVSFDNDTYLEPICNVDKIPRDRWRLVCYLCKERGVGACIQCSKPSCVTAYHVTCAQHNGFFMAVTVEEDAVHPRYTSFCHRHTPSDHRSRQRKTQAAFRKTQARVQKLLQQRATAAATVPTVSLQQEDDAGGSCRGEVVDIDSHSQQHRAVKMSLDGVPTMVPVMARSRVDSIVQRLAIVGHEQFVERVLGYWALKRQARAGVPLLRRLQVYRMQTESDAQQPQHQQSFSQQTTPGHEHDALTVAAAAQFAKSNLSAKFADLDDSEDGDLYEGENSNEDDDELDDGDGDDEGGGNASGRAVYSELRRRRKRRRREGLGVMSEPDQWQYVRHDLEWVRMLAEVVRQRERQKREAVRVLFRAWQLQVCPLIGLLLATLDQVCAVDSRKMFAKPVSVTVFRDYPRVIDQPMDLLTMRKKILDFAYSTFEEFAADLSLVFENSLRYFGSDSPLYRATLRVREKTTELMKDARERAEELERDVGEEAARQGVHFGELFDTRQYVTYGQRDDYVAGQSSAGAGACGMDLTLPGIACVGVDGIEARRGRRAKWDAEGEREEEGKEGEAEKAEGEGQGAAGGSGAMKARPSWPHRRGGSRYALGEALSQMFDRYSVPYVEGSPSDAFVEPSDPEMSEEEAMVEEEGDLGATRPPRTKGLVEKKAKKTTSTPMKKKEKKAKTPKSATAASPPRLTASGKKRGRPLGSTKAKSLAAKAAKAAMMLQRQSQLLRKQSNVRRVRASGSASAAEEERERQQRARSRLERHARLSARASTGGDEPGAHLASVVDEKRVTAVARVSLVCAVPNDRLSRMSAKLVQWARERLGEKKNKSGSRVKSEEESDDESDDDDDETERRDDAETRLVIRAFGFQGSSVKIGALVWASGAQNSAWLPAQVVASTQSPSKEKVPKEVLEMAVQYEQRMKSTASEQRYLVCFFNTRRTWAFVGTDRMLPMGQESAVEEELIAEGRRRLNRSIRREYTLARESDQLQTDS